MKTNWKTRIVILQLILLGCLCDAQGQSRGVVEAQSCDYLTNALDYSLIDSRTNDKASLILIFRPGSSEKSKWYSIVRTKFINRYLKYRAPKFTNVVFAQGEIENKLGGLEIYIAGEKKWTILFMRNRTGWKSCAE